MKIALQYNDTALLFSSKQSLGTALRYAGDLKSAKETLLSTLSLSNDSLKLPYTYINLAYLYNDLAKRDSAVYYALRSLHMFEAAKNNASLASTYSLLTAIEEKNGDTKKALQYQRAYAKLVDTIFEGNMKEKLQEVERKYNMHVLESEKSRLLVRQQWYIISFLVFLLLLGLIAFFVYRRVAYLKANYLKQEAILREKEAEQKEAREQIEENLNETDVKYKILLQQRIDILRKIIDMERYTVDSMSATNVMGRVCDLFYKQAKQDWGRLYMEMDECYNGLFTKIKQHYPELTLLEHHICCLSYAEFDNVNIGKMLGYSTHTIAQGKSDVRRKLGIGKGGEIKTFIERTVNRVA